MGTLDASEGQKFGSAVSLFGYTMAVLALDAQDHQQNYIGRVYVFAKSASGWYQQTKVVGQDTVFGDRFGASVGVSGTSIVAGAPRHGQQGTSSGAIYFLNCVTTTTTTTRSRVAVQLQPQNPIISGAGGSGGGDESASGNATQRAVSNGAETASLISRLLITLLIFVARH